MTSLLPPGRLRLLPGSRRNARAGLDSTMVSIKRLTDLATGTSSSSTAGSCRSRRLGTTPRIAELLHCADQKVTYLQQQAARKLHVGRVLTGVHRQQARGSSEDRPAILLRRSFSTSFPSSSVPHSQSNGRSEQDSNYHDAASGASTSTNSLHRYLLAAAAGLSGYVLLSATTPTSLVSDLHTPAGILDFSIDGGKAMLRDFVWFAGGATLFARVKDAKSLEFSVLQRQLRNSWEFAQRKAQQGEYGKATAELKSYVKSANRPKASLRWVQFAGLLALVQVFAKGVSYVRKQGLKTDELYTRHCVRREQMLRHSAARNDGNGISDGKEEQQQGGAGDVGASGKISYEDFASVVAAIRKNDFAAIADLFKIRSDIDMLLLLNLLRDVDALRPTLNWVIDGCVRRRTERELYIEVEKQAQRLVDELSPGFMERTLLPLLFRERLDTTSSPSTHVAGAGHAGSTSSSHAVEKNSGFVTQRPDAFYKSFLRHCLAFDENGELVGKNDTTSSGSNSTSIPAKNIIKTNFTTRLNPWVVWFPLFQAARFAALNPLNVSESVRTKLLGAQVAGVAGLAYENLKYSVRVSVRTWLHLVNGLVLGYAVYHGVIPYCLSSGTSTSTTSTAARAGGNRLESGEEVFNEESELVTPKSARTSASSLATAGPGRRTKKMKIIAKDGLLWRTRPLWFSTIGDEDHPQYGDVVEVVPLDEDEVASNNGGDWVQVLSSASAMIGGGSGCHGGVVGAAVAGGAVLSAPFPPPSRGVQLFLPVRNGAERLLADIV
ncbi:unnamed protein product [Amoebophrya sp. A120]|nr:unnamed protein product [Amoebophrya sp. A120]|eukprot:GSA120T00000400001.1